VLQCVVALERNTTSNVAPANGKTPSGQLLGFDSMSGGIRILPMTDAAGVIFQVGPRAVFSSTAWLLIFEVDLTNLTQHLERLRNQTDAEQHLARRLSKTFGPYNQTVDVLEEALRDTEKQLKSMVTLAGGSDENDEDKLRKLRSLPLLSSLGNIANALFGLATEDDVTMLQNRIDRLLKHNVQIDTLADKQITAFRAMEGQIKNVEQRLQQEINVTAGLLTTVQGLFGKSNTGAGSKGTEQTLLHLVWQNDMLSTLNYFRGVLDKVHTAVLSLLDGQLTPQLIGMNTLHDALKHVKQQLPPHLRLAIGPDSGIRQYYKLHLAHHLPQNGAIRGVIRIPLVNTLQEFRIYKAIPFPQFMPKAPELRFVLNVPPTYVGMTSDRTSFLDLGSTFDPSNCLSSDPLICPAQRIPTEALEQNCLYQLLSGRLLTEEKRELHCPLKIYSGNQTVIKAIDEVQWVISSKAPTNALINCLDTKDLSAPLQTRGDYPLQGNQRLFLPRQCTADIGLYKIPLRLQVKSEIIRGSQFGPMVQLQVQNFLDAHYQTLQEDQLQAELIKLLHEAHQLQNSSSELDTAKVQEILTDMTHQVQTLHVSNNEGEFHDHHYVYTSLIAVLAIMLCLGLWWLRRKYVIMGHEPQLKRTIAIADDCLPGGRGNKTGSIVVDELMSLVEHQQQLEALKETRDQLLSSSVEVDDKGTMTQPTADIRGMPFRVHRISPSTVRLKSINLQKVLPPADKPGSSRDIKTEESATKS
jgi:hypothetical protein